MAGYPRVEGKWLQISIEALSEYLTQQPDE
jgi:hypothetical protein